MLSQPTAVPGRQEPPVARQYDLDGKRIWIAGHRGMVGSAAARRLAGENCEIITVDRTYVDLRRQVDTEKWMERARPDVVVVAAAGVGGIHANSAYPADFLYDNMAIEGNIIRAAFNTGVEKLLFLGSSRKVMDVSKLREMGWTASTALRNGLEQFYGWFLSCAADPSQLRV